MDGLYIRRFCQYNKFVLKTFKVLMVLRVIYLCYQWIDERIPSIDRFDLNMARKYRSRYFAKHRTRDNK